jgi:hypothetical protein
MPLGLTISRGEPGMDMYGISEARVRQTINQAGGVVQESQLTNSTCPNFNGNLQFLTQEPTEGWVSKQYLVTHNSS